jgi:hypothetical protein
MPTLRTSTWVALLWLLLAILIFVGLGSINLPKLFAIASDFGLAEGSVLSTECSNHATVHCEYRVADRSYEGGEHLGDRCENLKQGDRLQIYYARSSPELSEAREPHGALVGELAAIGAAAIFLSPLIIFFGFVNKNYFALLSRSKTTKETE